MDLGLLLTNSNGHGFCGSSHLEVSRYVSQLRMRTRELKQAGKIS